MAPLPIRPGGIFWLSTPPNGEHLHVVVDGPNADHEFLIVNLSTVRRSQPPDPTVVFRPDPRRRRFLRSGRSYVVYRQARIAGRAKIHDLIEARSDSGRSTVIRWMDDADLERIRRGFAASDFVGPRLRERLQEFPEVWKHCGS